MPDTSISMRVLITGSNGFLGSECILECLSRGYSVRAVVRRPEALETLKAYPGLEMAVETGAIDFAVVKDQTVEGAYINAMDGCTHVIHAASPLPVANPGDLVPQAIGGAKAILEAAEATSAVKRIVFISSALALRPFEEIVPSNPTIRARIAGDVNAGPTMRADDVAPLAGELKSDAALERYVASKIASHNFVHEYASKRTPQHSHFSIIQLCPGYVCGPQRLLKNRTGVFMSTNMYMMYPYFDFKIGEFYGQAKGTDAPSEGLALHIDDCTTALVNALDTEALPASYRNFLLATQGPYGVRWEEQESIMKRLLPKESANTPWVSTLQTIPANFDCEKAEQNLLRRPFKTHEDIVVDTMRWFHELPQEYLGILGVSLYASGNMESKFAKFIDKTLLFEYLSYRPKSGKT